MPPQIAELIAKAQRFLADAANNVLAIYAEKGIEPFKKPLGVAAPLLLVIYLAVYVPLGDKIRVASGKLEASQAIAQGAGDYEDARKRLLAYQAKLPYLKDKDDWLSSVLMNTARTHGISFDVFSAQTEEEIDDFVVVSRKVELATAYETLGKWLADVESTPVFLRVVYLSVLRDNDNPLRVKVSLQLSTLFARGKQSTGASGRSSASPMMPSGGPR